MGGLTFRGSNVDTYIAICTDVSQAVYGLNNLHQAYDMHKVVVEVERFQSPSVEEAFRYWDDKEIPDWASDEVDRLLEQLGDQEK
jgi:hypothetical protein